MDGEQAIRVTKRLTAAAARFWPRMGEEARQDRVHDVLLEILEREARGEEQHTISWWAKHMYRRCHDRAQRIREVAVEDINVYSPISRPTQEFCTDAKKALMIVSRLPNIERRALLVRADGANPVEMAEEMSMPVPDVMRLLDRARLYVGDDGRYLWDGNPADRATA